MSHELGGGFNPPTPTIPTPVNLKQL